MSENEKVYKAYIDGMDKYIKELNKMEKSNPEKAKKRAVKSLLESGVFDTNGITKDNICN